MNWRRSTWACIISSKRDVSRWTTESKEWISNLGNRGRHYCIVGLQKRNAPKDDVERLPLGILQAITKTEAIGSSAWVGLNRLDQRSDLRSWMYWPKATASLHFTGWKKLFIGKNIVLISNTRLVWMHNLQVNQMFTISHKRLQLISFPGRLTYLLQNFRSCKLNLSSHWTVLSTKITQDKRSNVFNSSDKTTLARSSLVSLLFVKLFWILLRFYVTYCACISMYQTYSCFSKTSDKQESLFKKPNKMDVFGYIQEIQPF